MATHMDEQLKAKIKQLEALVAEIKEMAHPVPQKEHSPQPQQPNPAPQAPIQQSKPAPVPVVQPKPQPAQVTPAPTVHTQVAIASPQQPQAPVVPAPDQNPPVLEQPAGSSPDAPAGEGEDKASAIPEGEVGVFDGEFVHMGNEKKYQVPPNYVSKSMLVLGDKLQLVAHGDQNKFKIVEQVEREEISGILTKKDNQWIVLTDAGEFRVVAASIRFYEGEIGDTIEIVLPKNFRDSHPLWAAVKKVHRKNPTSKPTEEGESAPNVPAQPQHIEKPKQAPRSQPQTPPQVAPAPKPRPNPPTERPKPRIPEPTAPVMPFASEPELAQPKPDTLVIEPTEGSAELEVKPVSDADIPDLR